MQLMRRHALWILALPLFSLATACGDETSANSAPLELPSESNEMSDGELGNGGETPQYEENVDPQNDANTTSQSNDEQMQNDDDPMEDLSPNDEPDQTPVAVSSPLVDPNCLDGEWTEALPNPNISLANEIASFDSNNVNGFIFDVLTKRFPLGRELVERGLEGGAFGDCIGIFLRDRSSAEAVITQLSTIVHECAHALDSSLGTFSDNGYLLTQTITLTCADGDTVDRYGATFARSRIRNDGYQSQRAPCNGNYGGNCDSYADIYLDGDPDDSNFESGDQGFNLLIEEVLQYVNSLATGYAFNDFYRGSRSERDGILTFLWYLERYLRMARVEYPNAYEHLTSDPCWRELILNIWGRAWLYLETTEGMRQLGISDAELFTMATDPDLVEEIQRIREAHGCQ